MGFTRRTAWNYSLIQSIFYHEFRKIQREISRFLKLFSGKTGQLPESHSAGGSHIQGVHAVGHGDADGIVAGCDGFGRQAVTLVAEDDGELFFPGQSRVIDRYGFVSKGHGGGFEAQCLQ